MMVTFSSLSALHWWRKAPEIWCMVEMDDIYLSSYLSTSLYIYLSIYLSIYLYIFLSIYLCIYLSINQSTNIYIYLSGIYLSN